MWLPCERLTLKEVGKLPATVSDRRRTQAHDPGDLSGTASPEAAGFHSRIQPTLFIVQRGKEEAQLPVVLHDWLVGPANAVRATTRGGLRCAHGDLLSTDQGPRNWDDEPPEQAAGSFGSL
jgi:hypothetical protein